MPNGEVGLTEQLVGMYKIDFANVHLLDKGYSLVGAKAVAIIESGIRFLDGHFVAPLIWNS